MLDRLFAILAGPARLLLAGALVLVLIDVSAEDLDFVDSGQLLGNDQGNDVALGDLDGDGDLDAFVVNGFINLGPNQVYINQGGTQGGLAGQLLDSGQALGGSNSRAVALADLDGDGDLDALVANVSNGTDAADRIWWNNGSGTFQASGQLLSNENSDDVALADLDGDGDIDAVVAAGASGVANALWINQGGAQGGVEGDFLAAGTLGTAPAFAIALGDLDGDGDADAMLGVALASGNEIWINQGGAQFGTPGAFVDSGQRLVQGSGAGFIAALELADFDGDGDLDAYVANSGQFPQDIIWLNPGPDVNGDPGLFQAGWIGPVRPSSGIAVADFDDDGDLDVHVTHLNSISGRSNAVWFNDGSGMLSDSGLALGNSQSSAAAVGDLDGDGDIDVLVANRGPAPDRLWLANGAGGGEPVALDFVDSGQSLGFSSCEITDVALGDLDGDGDLDTLISFDHSSCPGAVVPAVYLNQGGAQGAVPGQLLRTPFGVHRQATRAIALGDLNGDGDLDAFSANGFNGNDSSDRILVNAGDGLGLLRPGSQALGNSVSEDVALGDLDGDGDLDAVVATPGIGVANTIWINEGGAQGGVTGVFLDAGELGTSSARAAELGDLDGDGDLDAMIGGALTGLELWINQGGAQAGTPGAFVDSGQRLVLGNGFAEAVYLADFDGDGNLDAYAANDGFNPEDLIWMNPGPDANGNPGTFQSGWGGPARASYDAAIADYDDDGDMDVFIAHLNAVGGRSNAVWLNDNSGNLSDSGLALGDSRSTAVAAGDVDGDGDLDVLVANLEAPSRLWLANGAVEPVGANLVLTPEVELVPQLPLGESDIFFNVLDPRGEELSPFLKRMGFRFRIANVGPETAKNVVFRHTASHLSNAGTDSVPPRFSDFFECDPAFSPLQADELTTCTAAEIPAGVVVNLIIRPVQPLEQFPSFSFRGSTIHSGSLSSGSLDPTPGGRTLTFTFDHYDCDVAVCPIQRVFCLNNPFYPEFGTPASRAGSSAPASLDGFRVDLSIYYLVRQTMNYGPDGQRLVQRYVAHGDEIWNLMEQDPTLFADAIEVLAAWQPLLAALVTGDPESEFVTQARVDLLDDFLAQLETLGSPALAQAIADERALIGPFDDLVGLTAGQAADLLIPSEVIFKNGFERPEILTD